jgi:hypothetical protein
MSKQIDWSQPLSDEDRAWAEQFPGLYAGLLEANAQQFPPKAEPSLEGEEPEEVPPYTEWTKAELVDETKRRNAEESKSLKVTGSQAELAKQLEDDDKMSQQ